LALKVVVEITVSAAVEAVAVPAVAVVVESGDRRFHDSNEKTSPSPDGDDE
jgi:hypothetical protein